MTTCTYIHFDDLQDYAGKTIHYLRKVNCFYYSYIPEQKPILKGFLIKSVDESDQIGSDLGCATLYLDRVLKQVVAK